MAEPTPARKVPVPVHELVRRIRDALPEWQQFTFTGTILSLREVLGFTNGPRPPFKFPGAWLYSSGQPVLHLNDISQSDRQQRTDSGVIDHVAFGLPRLRGNEAVSFRKGNSVPRHQVPNSPRWQIFLRDPNNVEIELNFESKDETSE